MFPIKFGIWVDEIQVFLSEKHIVKLIFELLWSPKSATELPNSATDFLSCFSSLVRQKSCPKCCNLAPIFCQANLKNIRIFALFCFELAFGVNMKVLDNFVRFPMALVWRENDFWFLSYDENTPRRS